jgi:hypothetical protein
VYSSYFVLLAAFLLIDDLPRIYRLLVQEKFTVPVHVYPVFKKRWQQIGRIGLKAATVFVFLILFFKLQLVNFLYDPYKQPSVAGIKKLRGNYNVTEFRINNQLLPYSPLDTVRWQEVTFEKWTTLTFKVNRPTWIDLSNGGGDPQRDINRTFELSGTGGGQRVFHYYADTVNNVLYLQDKYKAVPDRRNRAAGVGGDGGSDRNLNAAKKTELGAAEVAPKKNSGPDNWISKEAWANIGPEVDKIDKRAASTRRNREFATAPVNEKRNRMVLTYETLDGTHVILRGINEHKDSLFIVLDKSNRQYALADSKLEAGKY